MCFVSIESAESRMLFTLSGVASPSHCSQNKQTSLFLSLDSTGTDRPFKLDLEALLAILPACHG